MNNFNFWKNWSSPERRFYSVLLFVFSLSIIFYFIAYLKGIEWVIPTQLIATLREKPYIFSTFQKGLFSFSMEADAYIVFQYFEGGELRIPEWIIYIYLVFTGLFFTFSLTIISFLNRFWYLIGSALVVVFIVFLKLEQLHLFGWDQQSSLIAAFSLFIPVSYYFNSFNKNVSFSVRLLIFFILTSVFTIGILYGSSEEKPLIFLANYGLNGPIILALLFIFITAHEIPAGFLNIVTYSSTRAGTRTLIQFLAISLFYLVNVALVYLKNTGKIDWGIVYFDEFLILAICAVLGIWGFKSKSEQNESVISFRPLGAYAYLILGIICFSVIAYIFATANDPLQETFEDAIVYSQLGCGLMFLIYVIANFSHLIVSNLKVSRVLYKPSNMPLFTFRLASAISVLGLFYYSSQTPLYQAIAGYNNAIGDTYKTLEDDFTSKIYYEKAADFAVTNHHSNYAAATMLYGSERREALENYREALRKNPSEYAYLNLANHFLRSDKFFDALFVLNEGLVNFPQSELIQNNLGFTYTKSSITDSAGYYFSQCYNENAGNPVYQSNILGLDALALQSRIDLETELNEDFYVSGNYLSKSLFHGTEHGRDFQRLNETVENDPFDFGKLSYLHNSILFNNPIDSLSQKLDTLAKNHEWAGSYLGYAQALHHYKMGELSSSIKQLQRLADTPERRKSAYYTNLLGLICLEQNALIQAGTYFQSALDKRFQSEFNLALTLAELRDTVNSLVLLDTLLQSQESSNEGIELLKRILDNGSIDYALNVDDNEKYQWTRIWGGVYDMATLKSLLDSFEESNYKAEALIAVLEKWPHFDRTNLISLFDQILSENDLSEKQREKLIINRSLLLMGNPDRFRASIRSIKPKQSPENAKQLNSQIELIELWSRHLDEPEADLSSEFEDIGTGQPFLNEAVLAAKNYFMSKDQPYKGYEILLNAISINLYSTQLLEEYILVCAELNLDSSAKNVLDRLEPLESRERFQTISSRYDSLSQVYETIEF